MTLPCRRLLCLISLGLAAWLGGCDQREGMHFTTEESEPMFEAGRQLIRQGRNAEALNAFLKVIASRGENAPESHLEAALIYQQHIKDHIAAIYHFRKYLELQPNSRQAGLVRGRIDASKREFARTLPAHPLEDASVKISYLEQLDRLQRENDQLKSELTALRAGLPAGNAVSTVSGYRGSFDIPGTNQAAGSTSTVLQPTPPPVPIEGEPATEEDPSGESPFMSVPAETARAGTSPEGFVINTAPSASRQAPPEASTPTTSLPNTKPTRPGQTAQKPTPPAASGRRHVVQAKDTLSSISLRYYGTRSRVKDIIAANKDVLRDDNATLKLGMELRLP